MPWTSSTSGARCRRDGVRRARPAWPMAMRESSECSTAEPIFGCKTTTRLCCSARTRTYTTKPRAAVPQTPGRARPELLTKVFTVEAASRSRTGVCRRDGSAAQPALLSPQDQQPLRTRQPLPSYRPRWKGLRPAQTYPRPCFSARQSPEQHPSVARAAAGEHRRSAVSSLPEPELEPVREGGCRAAGRWRRSASSSWCCWAT